MEGGVTQTAAPTFLGATPISLFVFSSIYFQISAPILLFLSISTEEEGLRDEDEECQEEDGGRGKKEGLLGLHSPSQGPSGGPSEWVGGGGGDWQQPD